MSIFQKINEKRSSRDQIKIRSVENDLLVLPENEYRAILSVSSLNFELKSEAEQDLIVDNYKNFLNSLPVTIQILIRVREVDIKSYLSNFENLADNETDKLYKKQLSSYAEFVAELVSSSSILSRSFYLVVPLKAAKDANIDIVSNQIKLSINIINKSLASLDIKTQRLENLEILDLFHSFYSPFMSKQQTITSKTIELINGAYI